MLLGSCFHFSIFSFAFSVTVSAAEPVVHMLVPGFTVHELPVRLANINNLRFAPDGRLTALGYDGRIHLLRDTNGDGLEDQDELFWDKPTISVPVGMVWSPEGLYVSSHGKVSLLRDTDHDGKADKSEVFAGPFNKPTEMVPAPSGDLYVSDGYRNSRVHRFSKDGTLISSWGTPGKEAPGEFHLPHSLWVGPDGTVYVCDRENSRVQVFTAEGKFVSQWRDIKKPTDIWFNKQQVAYVSEQRPSISVMEKSGKVLARFETAASGHGLWVDSAGDIYLASVGAKKLIKYVRQRWVGEAALAGGWTSRPPGGVGGLGGARSPPCESSSPEGEPEKI